MSNAAVLAADFIESVFGIESQLVLFGFLADEEAVQYQQVDIPAFFSSIVMAVIVRERSRLSSIVVAAVDINFTIVTEGRKCKKWNAAMSASNVLFSQSNKGRKPVRGRGEEVDNIVFHHLNSLRIRRICGFPSLRVGSGPKEKEKKTEKKIHRITDWRLARRRLLCGVLIK